MDVFWNWLNFSIGLVIVTALGVCIRCGASVLRPAQLTARYRDAAAAELDRRGYATGTLTTSEHRAIHWMLGSAGTGAAALADEDYRRAAFALSTAGAEPADLEILVGERERLAAEAIDRARRWVRPVKALRAVAAVWKAAVVWSEIRVAVFGVRWFLPRWLATVGPRAMTWVGATAVVGALLGVILWLGIAQVNRGRVGDSMWDVAGSAMGFCAVVTILAIAVVQLRVLASSLREESQPVPWRSLAPVGIASLVGGAAVLVVNSEAYVSFMSWSSRWARDVMEGWVGGEVVGAVLLAGAVGYACRNGVRMISLPRVPMSERLSLSAALLLLVCCAGGVLIMVFDVPVPNLPSTVLVVTCAVFSMMVLSAVVAAIEFVVRWSKLRRAGHHVLGRRTAAFGVASLMVFWIVYPVVFGAFTSSDLVATLPWEVGYALAGALVAAAVPAVLGVPALVICAFVQVRRINRAYRASLGGTTPSSR